MSVTILPDRDRLLVSTDLHGNFEDFTRLREIFADLCHRHPKSHWVILGDALHGPSPAARTYEPALYDFEDRSWEVMAGIMDLADAMPGRVHYVLGNHDHGHLGGPRPGKFYPDEVAAFEARLDRQRRAQLIGFLERAVLMVVAPCGILMAHGSPDDSLASLNDLRDISYRPDENDDHRARLLYTTLRSYGQPGPVTARLLATVAAEVGFPMTVVVHGHDRDEAGWFIEGGNQLCVVLFGATREQKRYLVLDLAVRYESVDSLRVGQEVRRLYFGSQGT